ncbi:hypothetical protein B0H17DRAFT_1326833 [Mycena rosella]|uniref:Uncharacterized protein n=1 Tax=Mycena rosella TaxID=1033263 RepID=A0AAD7GRN4_MYCRO|nr:hypothetical protein B0H17DRAFT_1326833 [Mycena rosella]
MDRPVQVRPYVRCCVGPIPVDVSEKPLELVRACAADGVRIHIGRVFGIEVEAVGASSWYETSSGPRVKYDNTMSKYSESLEDGGTRQGTQAAREARMVSFHEGFSIGQQEGAGRRFGRPGSSSVPPGVERGLAPFLSTQVGLLGYSRDPNPDPTLINSGSLSRSHPIAQKETVFDLSITLERLTIFLTPRRRATHA